MSKPKKWCKGNVQWQGYDKAVFAFRIIWKGPTHSLEDFSPCQLISMFIGNINYCDSLSNFKHINSLSTIYYLFHQTLPNSFFITLNIQLQHLSHLSTELLRNFRRCFFSAPLHSMWWCGSLTRVTHPKPKVLLIPVEPLCSLLVALNTVVWTA